MTISFRAMTPWLALLFAAALLAGCGGSGDAPSASSTEASQSAAQSEPEAEAASEAMTEPESEADSMAESGDGMSPESEAATMQEADSSGMSETAMQEQMAEAAEESAMTQAAAGGSAGEDPVTVGEDGVARVTIGATDQMQYTVKEFSVEAGQEVELTLVHEGELAVEVMGHNVVILPADGDYAAFSQQASSQGGTVENSYLPEGMRENLIAYTDLIGGGETATVTFTAPDTPGEYPFVCTFPGHFAMMNGVMIVR